MAAGMHTYANTMRNVKSQGNAASSNQLEN
jgi:hypothetical protein